MAPRRQTNRAFGYSFAGLFTAIGLVSWLLFERHVIWPFAISGVFLILALAAPGILLPLNRLWATLGHRIGTVNNYILLGVFFYLFITPIGVLMRAFGWDPLRVRDRASGKSRWAPVTRDSTPETFGDMF